MFLTARRPFAALILQWCQIFLFLLLRKCMFQSLSFVSLSGWVSGWVEDLGHLLSDTLRRAFGVTQPRPKCVGMWVLESRLNHVAYGLSWWHASISSGQRFLFFFLVPFLTERLIIKVSFAEAFHSCKYNNWTWQNIINKTQLKHS